MTRPAIPHAIGIYLGVVQLLFTLCWTVYVIYLPRLAEQVGLQRSAVLTLLMLDQAIFTITDFAMGVAADRVSNLVGRLGRLIATITAISCAAFLLLPFIAGIGSSTQWLFLGLTLTWVVTSSALRAPPLVLLGKYAARPAIPWLSSLIVLGIGIVGAAAPYLTVELRNIDPRWPFALSSIALMLTTFGLVIVERRLASLSTASRETVLEKPALEGAGRSPALTIAFIVAVTVLAAGFQLHFFIDSAPLFRRFAEAARLEVLMPIFWIGFNIVLLPASLMTSRLGGLAVMGGAGLVGAVAIAGAHLANNLELLIAFQLVAGAAWGCMLMSAMAAALAIGYTGYEGRITGVMFSALALATLTRMAAVASGVRADPAYSAMLQWAPSAAWSIAGAALLILVLMAGRNKIIPVKNGV
jgi:hypothetical protein